MAEKDIARIRVSNFSVGIVGIKGLMEEMAETHADKPDDAVRSFMLDRLGKDNYIPERAKDDYGRAFLREFRKSLGQCCRDDAPGGLEIKVLGPGCKRCHETEKIVREAVAEAGSDATVQYITDMAEIAKHGIFSTPAVIVDGNTRCVGRVPSKADVKAWLGN